MKITQKKLQQIIREETGRYLEWHLSPSSLTPAGVLDNATALSKQYAPDSVRSRPDLIDAVRMVGPEDSKMAGRMAGDKSALYAAPLSAHDTKLGAKRYGGRNRPIQTKRGKTPGSSRMPPFQSEADHVFLPTELISYRIKQASWLFDWSVKRMPGVEPAYLNRTIRGHWLPIIAAINVAVDIVHEVTHQIDFHNPESAINKMLQYSDREDSDLDLEAAKKASTDMLETEASERVRDFLTNLDQNRKAIFGESEMEYDLSKILISRIRHFQTSGTNRWKKAYGLEDYYNKE